MKPIIELAMQPPRPPVKPKKRPLVPEWLKLPFSRPGAINLCRNIEQFTP